MSTTHTDAGTMKTTKEAAQIEMYARPAADEECRGWAGGWLPIAPFSVYFKFFFCSSSFFSVPHENVVFLSKMNSLRLQSSCAQRSHVMENVDVILVGFVDQLFCL